VSITLTRQSATEWRVLLPAVGGSSTQFIEWRIHVWTTGMYGIQGYYGREMAATPSTDVQLSDATDSSVPEYAMQIAETGAGAIGYDFFGMAHSNEAPTMTPTFTLDAVSVTGWSTAQTGTGTTFIINQASNTLLPLNANGTPNGSTVCGSNTVRHTFTAAGLLVEHTHTLNAGYVGKTDYSAMLPISVANFNRVAIGSLPVYTPLNNGLAAASISGTQAATFSAWHASAHPYKITMTLPSGGPDSTGLWTNSGPDYSIFLDNVSYGKFYVFEQGSTLALARNLGTFSCSQFYAVSINDSIVFDDSVFGAEPFMQDISADITPSDAPVTVATTTDMPVTA
jgi:hypothetical protein